MLCITKERRMHMAEMKNLCGKIPVELHIKVRQEIEAREISTQQFIQQVIEEHFTEKGGQVSMAVRTLAVQVSEELFRRFKAAVAKKGCKQKDFLIDIIERAIEEIENAAGTENQGETEEDSETAVIAAVEAPETEEIDSEESKEEEEENKASDAEEPEAETLDGENTEEDESEDSEEPDAGEPEDASSEEIEAEAAELEEADTEEMDTEEAEEIA
jgi:predicted DNA binding CopG/RHH family protein